MGPLIHPVKRKKRAPEFLENKYLLLGFFYLLLFAIFFPKHIFMHAEISYLNRAFDLTEQFKDLSDYNFLKGTRFNNIQFNYPLGTSFLVASFIIFFGKKSIFSIGAVCLLASYYLIWKTLKKNKLPVFASLLCFFFFPAVLMSRTLMPEMPSLLICSLFTFIYLSDFKNRNVKMLIVSFLAGLSIWFRETNILLFAILLIGPLFKNPSFIFSLIPGFLLGLLPRLQSSDLVYGNPLFLIQNPGRFSFNHVWGNLPIYSIVFIFFFPLGLYFIFNIRNKKYRLFQLTAILYFVFHLIYGYNPTPLGDLKTIMLSPRFFVPLIPIMAIIYGSAIQNSDRIFRMSLLEYSMPILSVVSIVGINMGMKYYEKDHQEVVYQIKEINNKNAVFIYNRFGDAAKIINPLHGKFKVIQTESLLKKPGKLMEFKEKYDADFYYLANYRFDTGARKGWTKDVQAKEKTIFKDFQLKKVSSVNILDGREFILNELVSRKKSAELETN